MMLAFMWLRIKVFGTEGVETLDFRPMAIGVFHIEHSHNFADFTLKT